MKIVIAYFAVAASLALYTSLRNWRWYDTFPEDLYLIAGFCLLWPVSVPIELWHETRK